MFKDVAQFYDARSRIVHGERTKLSAAAKQEAFEKGFGVARDSVVKLLVEGAPTDWNELILRHAESPLPLFSKAP